MHSAHKSVLSALALLLGFASWFPAYGAVCGTACVTIGSIPSLVCGYGKANSTMYSSRSAAIAACMSTLGSSYTGCTDGCTATGAKQIQRQWLTTGNPAGAFYYVDDEYCNNRCNLDGDCIMDDIDPYPGDASSFTFQEFGYQLDASGRRTFVTIKTDRGDYFSYGTRDETKTYWALGSSAPVKDGCTLEAAYFDEASTSTIPNVTAGSPAIANDPFASPTLETGDQQSVGESDSDRLGKIVDNTAKALSNQGDIVHALGQVAGAIGDQTKLLSEKDFGGGGVVSGGGLSESQTSDAVEQGIGQALDERTTAEGDFSGVGTEDFSAYSNLTQEEIGSPGSMTETLNENLPVGGYGALGSFFTGSQLQASGVCSFTFPYKGNSISFGLCNFQDQLQIMGVLLLALSGVYALMIVLGKA